MSDTTADATATDAQAAEQDQHQDDAQKPTETVDFWKSKSREWETRAKENSKAAARLKEIEDAQKSDAEKAAERIATLEQQATAAQRDALRFKVAAKHGIGDEDADLFLTGADEATLTKQAERLAGRSDASTAKTRLRVPREGTHPGDPKEDEERKAARQLFGSGGGA